MRLDLLKGGDRQRVIGIQLGAYPIDFEKLGRHEPQLVKIHGGGIANIAAAFCSARRLQIGELAQVFRSVAVCIHDTNASSDRTLTPCQNGNAGHA